MYGKKTEFQFLRKNGISEDMLSSNRLKMFKEMAERVPWQKYARLSNSVGSQMFVPYSENSQSKTTKCSGLLITRDRESKVCLQLCSFQHINTKIFARKTYNRFIEQLIKSLQDFRDLADSSCVKQHTQDGAHEVCSILKTCNFFFSFQQCVI